MSFSETQRGVVLGASTALVITLLALGAAVLFELAGLVSATLTDRLQLFAICALAPAMALTVSIARVANFRFSSSEDIDGSGLTSGSSQIKIRQSLLQNTLEQMVLALAVYAAWVLIAPSQLLAALPAAAMLFLVGRFLFFWGYARGAPGRSMGFGLTFYPSWLLLVGCVVMAISGTGAAL